MPVKISVKKLIKKYNERTVLDIEELSLEEGRIYAFIGLNGSGKSTLMECIAGLIDYDSGTITYDGSKDIKPVRRNISMCAQKHYLFDKSVKDNIAWGLRLRKEDKALVDKRLNQYLKFFELEGILNKNAKRLSGGEGAKTALLRAAMLQTELTILDEPTASMDIESVFQAEKLIRSMAGGKRTVVLVTHDMFQAKRLADKVIFMDKGHVVEEGDSVKIFKSPQSNQLKKILNLG
jgi:tungstate transport system ATP-binding protein